MAEFDRKTDADISDFYLIEGLPGTGLVAKIAADYLIEALDMEVYAEVYSEDLEQVTVFGRNDPQIKPPTRIFFDQDTNIAVLKSDAPVHPDSDDFIDSLTDWVQENNIKPVLLTGLPIELKEDHAFFRVKNGELGEELDVEEPPIEGGIGGPTGALFANFLREDIDAVGLVVQSDPRFPDPEASRIIIEQGIEPLTNIDLNTQELKESADEIKQKKKQLAEKLQQLQEHGSEAYPREMYH